MYLLDQYRGTTLSCRYMIPHRLAPAESRTQLEEAVKIAVVGVIMRHPMLQVGIIDVRSGTPSWTQLQKIVLTEYINWLYIEGHDDFEQTVQQTFRYQLDGHLSPDSLYIRDPDWKFTIIRQGDAPFMEVLLTWNHPQFDGAGAKVIHEDFLEMLNADSGAYKPTGLHGDTLTLPQTRPVLPEPIESLVSLPVDPKVLGKAFWEDIRPQFLNRDVSYAAWCPIRTRPYKTQCRTFHISNASLLAILALCRHNKTTITGLLNGLALVAFSAHLDATIAPAFQSSTIMDHRRNLPPAPADAPWVRSDRAVSNYVTQCLHTWDTKLVSRVRSKLSAEASDKGALSTNLQHELWAISAQNRLEIVCKLESGLRNDLIGLFKHVTNWHKTMTAMATKKRQFTWLVTNIGVMDGNMPSVNLKTETPAASDVVSDDCQNWSISRAQFGLSAETPFAAIEFGAVSVAGGGMCVSAMWLDCAVEEKFGEKIVADMESWLPQLASQS